VLVMDDEDRISSVRSVIIGVNRYFIVYKNGN